MSIYKLFIPLVLLIVIGCGSDSSTNTDTTSTPPALPKATTTPPTTPPAKTPEPAQNAAGVWHYTCPKGCEGGGASAIACAGCGTTLAHNQAYHGAAATTPSITPPAPGGTAPISPILTNPNPSQTTTTQQPLTIPPKPNEPPQNAAGVWHYTCSAGCAGGGGSATACAGCGKTLVHNTAYHQ